MCLRFLPIETVCQAKLGDISTAAKALCREAFPAGAEAVPIKFAVQYEHRASVSLKRGDVIDAVVGGVPQVTLINTSPCRVAYAAPDHWPAQPWDVPVTFFANGNCSFAEGLQDFS